MIILIDNYDSFTYNLVHYLGECGVDVTVFRNDAKTVDEILSLKPAGLVISPGPSDPDHAGICLDLIGAAEVHDTPLFGVCLGHQSIGQYFGGDVVRTTPKHGKTDEVAHEGKGVFKNTPSPITVTRYHSLTVDPQSLPDCLEVTAQTQDGIIMGLRHKTKPIEGVQFHPESIATQHGHAMIKNFLNRV